MGQYFYTINISKKQWLKPNDFGNGLKLLEHSFVDNHFCESVMRLLATKWKGDSISWAGDYEDSVDITNFKPIAPYQGKLSLTPEEIADIVEDYKDYKDKNTNLFNIAEIVFAKLREEDIPDITTPRYLVNLDKNEWVDVEEMPVTRNGEWTYQLHPLPLLTASSNGRGGGDYYFLYPDYELIGTWCGDHLEATDTKPTGKQITPYFVEEVVLDKPGLKRLLLGYGFDINGTIERIAFLYLESGVKYSLSKLFNQKFKGQFKVWHNEQELTADIDHVFELLKAPSLKKATELVNRYFIERKE